MNYSKAINASNVKITTYSPRAYGEQESRSQYKEVKNIPFAFSERVALIEKLASENKEVIVKTATRGGHARIFIVK